MMRTAISPRFAMSTLVIRRSVPVGSDTEGMNPNPIDRHPRAVGRSVQTPRGSAVPALQSLPPEGGPGGARLADQATQRRQGEPDDGGRVARDRGDERSAEAVDREGAGDGERLARRDVGVDLVVVEVVDEADLRARDRAEPPAGPPVDQPVPGV